MELYAGAADRAAILNSYAYATGSREVRALFEEACRPGPDLRERLARLAFEAGRWLADRGGIEFALMTVVEGDEAEPEDAVAEIMTHFDAGHAEAPEWTMPLQYEANRLASERLASDNPPTAPGDLAVELREAVPFLKTDEAALAAVRAFHTAGRPVGEGALVEASRAVTTRMNAEQLAAWDATAEVREWEVAEWNRRSREVARPPVPPVREPKEIDESRQPPNPTGEPARHGLHGVLDLRRRMPLAWFEPGREFAPPKWAVKGIIPQSGLAMILGEYQAGKSFAAIDLALHIAWGLSYMGRKVRQGGVVYIAAEGGLMMVHHRFNVAERELQGRIAAENLARKDRGEPPLRRAPIAILPQAPNLSRTGDPRPLEATVEDAKQAIEAGGFHMAAVVLDTLHVAMAGAEENSASDAGHVLAPLRGIADRHETAAILVHHLGKDAERGSRGSNAFPAAMDAILEIRVPGHEGPKPKPASAIRTVTATKVRDADAGASFSFRLATVEVGRDEDGDPVVSCYVEPVVEPKVDGEGMTDLDREFWALIEARMKGGRCAVFEVREAWMDGHRKGKAETARRLFNRAKTNALRAGRLLIDPHERWFELPQ